MSCAEIIALVEKAAGVRPQSVLAKLLEAKALSDQRQYQLKHEKIRQLLEKYPQDFIVDSADKDIVGLTQKRLGFKIHVPRRILPASFQSPVDVQHDAANRR